MKFRLMFSFSTLFLLAPSSYLEAGIEAGVAIVEITPAESLQMAGYSARKEPSKGVLDPLFVRAMVLRNGQHSVGFVVYDLIGTLGRKVNEELTSEIRQSIGLNEIFFIATHSHSGPALRGADVHRIDALPAYEREVATKTQKAVLEAWQNLEAVRIGAGCGSVDINYNRIKKLPDGKVQMIWENPGREPLGPAEQELYVLKIDNLKGKTKLLLVNYACHPVILGSDNLYYSADYPGAMCREIEDSHPDKPRCIFINGACGDMNPYFADENDKPAERIREVGGELAKEVIRLSGTIVTKEETSPISISWKRSSIEAQGRWDLNKWGSEVADENGHRAVERLSRKMEDLNLPVSVVLITPEIGFVGLPGEFFSSFQNMLRRQSPLRHLLVAGYTDGAFGYFPDISAAVVGGYGANDTATYLRPGTGEHIVIEAVVNLNELMGRLRDLPASSSTGYRN